MILDIHTHNLDPNPEAIIDISGLLPSRDLDSILADYPGAEPHCQPGSGLNTVLTTESEVPVAAALPQQYFSVGIHPWSLQHEEPAEELLTRVRHAAAHPRVLIIGEAGIDIPKGGPLFRQMLIFKQMALLAEKVRKPLLIHNVKANEIILSLHKEIRPSIPWIIHGFRGKPSVAEMFLRQNFYFSFGQNFNPLALRSLPTDRILAETDTSPLPIAEIIHLLSDARGFDLTGSVASNTARLMGK